MRTKLRAWDDVKKQMSYGKIEQFDDMLGFRFDHFETESPIYLEFTELHDKNGKEIYEGDVWSEGKSIGLIIYKDDGFEIDWKHNPELWSETLKYHAKHGKVIGNIYENPELLERNESS